MSELLLSFKRDGETWDGSIAIDAATPAAFAGLSFKRLIASVSDALHAAGEPLPKVLLQRTDHEGLLPYVLDEATVRLIHDDPVAAFTAMSTRYDSPGNVLARMHAQPQKPRLLTVGHDVLANAFGDYLYTRVRKHELECPGCGFWGMYATPGLLADKDRAGDVFKTIFVCRKKCLNRFPVTCTDTWAYVSTAYLLDETNLAGFFFPRGWNEGKPWVSRERLTAMFDAYKAEKESAS